MSLCISNKKRSEETCSVALIFASFVNIFPILFPHFYSTHFKSTDNDDDNDSYWIYKYFQHNGHKMSSIYIDFQCLLEREMHWIEIFVVLSANATIHYFIYIYIENMSIKCHCDFKSGVTLLESIVIIIIISIHSKCSHTDSHSFISLDKLVCLVYHGSEEEKKIFYL